MLSSRACCLSFIPLAFAWYWLVCTAIVCSTGMCCCLCLCLCVCLCVSVYHSKGYSTRLHSKQLHSSVTVFSSLTDFVSQPHFCILEQCPSCLCVCVCFLANSTTQILTLSKDIHKHTNTHTHTRIHCRPSSLTHSLVLTVIGYWYEIWLSFAFSAFMQVICMCSQLWQLKAETPLSWSALKQTHKWRVWHMYHKDFYRNQNQIRLMPICNQSSQRLWFDLRDYSI